MDVRAYGEEVLRRFTNPALGHTTQKVGTDGSQKLGPRLLGRVQGATAPEGVVRALLGETEVFPEGVGGHPGFAEAVTRWYGILQRQDPETLREEAGDV